MTKKAVGYFWCAPNSKKYNEQIKKIKSKVEEYCEGNEIHLKKFYKDVGSTGSAIKRQKIQDMFNYIDNHDIDYLILDSLYTLGRRFHDAIVILNEFKGKNIGLISIDEKIDTTSTQGKQMIKALFKIPQVTKMVEIKDKNKKIRTKEILYSGGACPYGYKIDKKSNLYVVLEKEAVVIKRIFRERAAGRSLRQICNDLNNDKISTKRGGKWQANTIKTILENPFYIGIYTHEEVTYKDCHDAIVTEYLFSKVNSKTNNGIKTT